MGGSGKSVLAAAAARDPKVREAFPDGQFWLELGPDPPLLQLQASLAAALGDSTPITDVPQGRARLSRLLAERRCLLVLDNVWDQAHLSAFAVAGPPGRVLVTTRDTATVPGATVIPLDELSPEAALQLLAGWTATPARRAPGGGGAGRAGMRVPAAGPGAVRRDDRRRRATTGRSCSACSATPTWTHSPSGSRITRTRAWRSRWPPASTPSLPMPATGTCGSPCSTVKARSRRPPCRCCGDWTSSTPPPSSSDLAGKSLLRAEAGRISLHDLQMDYLVRRAAGPACPARPAARRLPRSVSRQAGPAARTTGTSTSISPTTCTRPTGSRNCRRCCWTWTG